MVGECFDRHILDPMLTKDSGQSVPEASRGRSHVEQDPEDRQAWFRSMWEGKPQDEPPPQEGSSNDADDDDDDFGDDFDDFAEGGGDDDFGDFDDATTTPSAAPEPQPQPTAPSSSVLAGLVSSFVKPSPSTNSGSKTTGKLTFLAASFRPQSGSVKCRTARPYVAVSRRHIPRLTSSALVNTAHGHIKQLALPIRPITLAMAAARTTAAHATTELDTKQDPTVIPSVARSACGP